jgi:hypothetical protein
MKLKEAIKIGKDSGLDTIEECILNISHYCMNIFTYEEINMEMKELFEDLNEYLKTGKLIDNI